MHYPIKAFKFDIFCIAHDLGVLGVVQKIEVISFL